MTPILRTGVVVFMALAAVGCSQKKLTETQLAARDFVKIANWLEGDFTNAEQAARDERYFEVELHHAKIWPLRGDGQWFYVEQAMADTPDAPYRQRVYQLWIRGDRVTESRVYELPEPEKYIGAHADVSLLGSLSPDDLTLRAGCEVVFTEVTDDYAIGETLDEACASEMRGAAYATSRVRLSKDEIRSWDRGFDADGEQAWGAETGPYVFTRVGRR